MTDRERWQGIAIGVALSIPVIAWVALIALVQR